MFFPERSWRRKDDYAPVPSKDTTFLSCLTLPASRLLMLRSRNVAVRKGQGPRVERLSPCGVLLLIGSERKLACPFHWVRGIFLRYRGYCKPVDKWGAGAGGSTSTLFYDVR